MCIVPQGMICATHQFVAISFQVYVTLRRSSNLPQDSPAPLSYSTFMYMPTILDCNFGKHVAQKVGRGFAMLQACSLCCWEPVLHT